MRLFIVANVAKPLVKPAIDELIPWLKQRVEVVGMDEGCSGDWSNINADCILVLGGDGTLLATARKLNGRPIPVMGINYGRLGFLADFTPAQFKPRFEEILKTGFVIQKRAMLEASIIPQGSILKLAESGAVEKLRRFSSTALNDVVITAGSPFRMIDLQISADGDSGVQYSGDGVIVATASGSTAYNVSAGGPILSPNVDAMCITPICPHSLSFRPVVLPMSSVVYISAKRVNTGTTLICDGQVPSQLLSDDVIVIRRSKNIVQMVDNPETKEFRVLAERLNWAEGPRYNEK